MNLDRQTVWNELALSLKRWDELNDKMARMESVDPVEHRNLGIKIQTLDHQLAQLDEKKDVA